MSATLNFFEDENQHFGFGKESSDKNVNIKQRKGEQFYAKAKIEHLKHNLILDNKNPTKITRVENDNTSPLIDLAKLRSQRQKNWQPVKYETKSSHVALNEKARDLRELRAHNRMGYLSRKEVIPQGIPFLLIKKNFVGTDLERFRAYNRHNKCKCGRRCNIFYNHVNYFIPSCDHQNKNIFGENREIIAESKSNGQRCLNCHSPKTKGIMRRKCDCIVTYCEECLYTSYCLEGKHSLLCLCKQEDDINSLTIPFKMEMVKTLVDNGKTSYASAIKKKVIIDYMPNFASKNKFKQNRKLLFNDLIHGIKESNDYQNDKVPIDLEHIIHNFSSSDDDSEIIDIKNPLTFYNAYCDGCFYYDIVPVKKEKFFRLVQDDPEMVLDYFDYVQHVIDLKEQENPINMPIYGLEKFKKKIYLAHESGQAEFSVCGYEISSPIEFLKSLAGKIRGFFSGLKNRFDNMIAGTIIDKAMKKIQNVIKIIQEISSLIAPYILPYISSLISLLNTNPVENLGTYLIHMGSLISLQYLILKEVGQYNLKNHTFYSALKSSHLTGGLIHLLPYCRRNGKTIREIYDNLIEDKNENEFKKKWKSLSSNEHEILEHVLNRFSDLAGDDLYLMAHSRSKPEETFKGHKKEKQMIAMFKMLIEDIRKAEDVSMNLIKDLSTFFSDPEAFDKIKVGNHFVTRNVDFDDLSDERKENLHASGFYDDDDDCKNEKGEKESKEKELWPIFIEAKKAKDQVHRLALHYQQTHMEKEHMPKDQNCDNSGIEKYLKQDIIVQPDVFRVPLFKKEKEVISGQAEMGETFIDGIKFLLEKLFNILKIPYDSIRANLSFRALSNFNTLCSFWRNIKDLFSKFMWILPEWLVNYFSNKSGYAWLKTQIENPKSLAYQLLEKSMRVKMAIENHLSKEELQEIRNEASEALMEFELYVCQNKLLDQQVVSFIDLIKKYNNTVCASELRSREPFCVRITGASGCGKSTYWPNFISPITGNLSPEEVEKITYMRNPALEFFDGLRVKEHRIICYDDFMQNVDEKDVSELINIVSKAMFYPPMASIDTSNPAGGFKGESYEPDIVVCLSNTTKVEHTVSIKEVKAIERRFHITIQYLDNFDKAARITSTVIDLDKANFKVFNTNGLSEFVTGIDNVHNLILRVYEQFVKSSTSISDMRSKYMCKRTTMNALTNMSTSNAKISQYLRKEKDSDSFKSVEQGRSESDEGTNDSEKPKEKLGLFSRLYNYTVSNLVHPLCKRFTELSDWIRDTYCREESFSSYLWNCACVTIFGLACGFILGFLYILLTKINLIRKFVGIEVETGEGESGTTHTRTGISKLIRGHKQSTTPDYLYKNQFHLTITSGGKTRDILGLFIKGRYFITVKHAFLAFNSDIGGTTIKFNKQVQNTFLEEGELTMTFADGRIYRDKFTPTRLFDLKGKDEELYDLIVYKCSNTIPMCKDIVNHFISDHCTLKNKEIIFNGINCLDHQRIVKASTVENDNFVLEYDVGKEMWLSAESFSYRVRTQRGDCGAFVTTDANQPQIVGIHIGSYQGRGSTAGMTFGTSARITKKILDELFFSLEEEPTNKMEFGIANFSISEITTNLDLGPRIEVLGTVKIPNYPLGKSEIIPSPLFGLIGHENTTAPAIININDKRLNGELLFEKGIKKYGKLLPIKDDYDEEVFNSLKELVNRPSHENIEQRELTLDECINGNGVTTPLDMSTSPGFPWSCSGNGGDKKKLFDFIDDKYVMKPEIEQEYHDYVRNLSIGNIYIYPWVDCLKDERRSLEKIKQCKTRVFSSAPMFYILAFKQQFGAFLEHLNHLRIRTFYRIGMNKDSIEWDEHVRSLIQVGKNFLFDGDMESMDGNNSVQNIILFFRLANSWYNREESMLQKSLREIECFAFHLYYSKDLSSWVLIRLIGGTNSGTLITTPVNSISLEANFRRAFLELAPAKFRDLFYYNRFVRTCTFGDDSIVSVHPEIKDWFNFENVQRIFATYGCVLTSGTKDKETNWKKIDEVTFLKNYNGYILGRFVPLMEFNAMIEPLLWIRKSEFNSDDKMCEDNCNAVLRNAFYYGEQNFNALRNKILEIKPQYNLITYAYLFYQFIHEDYEDPLSLNQKKTKSKYYTL